MKKTATTRAARVRRHARVRKRVSGTEQKPRLAVFRSLTHIYAQVIDDVARSTIVSASDIEADVMKQVKGKKKSEAATIVGGIVAQRAKEKGVTRVVFDRGGYPFHGRIRALAQAAREGGLEF
jgi:large subunit ribosomal protein L18